MSYGNQFSNSNSPSGEYFASLGSEDTASICLSKADSFFNMLRANSYLDKLSYMWRAYHGAYGDYVGFGHRINFTGEQGELVALPVNHFRNIAQHMYNMITSNRPVMEARAVNTDYKSLAQTYLANGILDYYMREKHLEDALKKAVELAIVMGSGFIKLEWNATAGETYDYDDETGQFNYEGEIEFSNLSPFDVVVDGTKESWNNDWILVRNWKNKYDLMAKYPELADRIKAIPTKNASNIYRLAVFSNDDTDDIAVYEFFHRRTESMPEGRYLLFLDGPITLLDVPLPYRVMPVFRIAAGEILGTPYGYSSLWDCYPLQEMLNATYSAIATNQNAFAVQNLWVERGADISVNSLDGAMNIIEGLKKPEPLQLTATPQEVYKFADMLVQAMETISGINSVTRGNPEKSLQSGAALALVQSMALQFISGLQQSYVKLVENVGTALIQILKDYANTPKIVALVGKNNRPLLKEFTGEQISSINRVIVDVGNPLSRTVAGRVQMAEQMLQMKLLTTPQQYLEVINTGQLATTYEGEMSELLLIKMENEKLLEGAQVQAVNLDQHHMHIMEHKAVISDPELRQDNKLVENALNHIQQHIDLLRQTDPGLLSSIGEQPLPPMQPPGMPPQGPPGPNGGPPSPLPSPGMQGPGGPPQGMPPGPGNPGLPPGHTGPHGGRPPMGKPPVHSVKGAPMARGMAGPDGSAGPPGIHLQTKEVNNQLIPQVPMPPKPFQNLPTDPSQMIPPGP